MTPDTTNNRIKELEDIAARALECLEQYSGGESETARALADRLAKTQSAPKIPEGAKTTEIAFTRLGGGLDRGLELLTLVRITHDPKLGTPEKVMGAFKRGITKWVETTEEGEKLWDYSCEDLNIGDIGGLESDGALGKLLATEGIHSWEETFCLCSENNFSYDTILADPE